MFRRLRVPLDVDLPRSLVGAGSGMIHDVDIAHRPGKLLGLGEIGGYAVRMMRQRIAAHDSKCVRTSLKFEDQPAAEHPFSTSQQNSRFHRDSQMKTAGSLIGYPAVVNRFR